MRSAPRPAWLARTLASVALVVLLAACGEAHVVSREPTYEPPSQEAPVARRAGPGEIEVIRGDTLYGIAFRNGMDFRDLAAINGVEPPYTIYVGQILKLHGDRMRPSTPPVEPVAQTPQPRPVRAMPQPTANASNPPPEPMPTPFQTVQSPPPRASTPIPTASNASSTNPSAENPPPASHPVPAVQPALQPSPPPRPTSAAPLPQPVSSPSNAARVVSAPPVERTPSAAILPNVVAPSGGIAWRWPAKGALLDRFMAGDATRQGIDIGGNAGEPVLAAADGVVVYSGSGLVGYGELIIVKHSDEWLSAYGHNSKRLVAEGQRVRGGQAIAEMGRSGAPRDELHFEIRRNGRPVDPLQYLPSR